MLRRFLGKEEKSALPKNQIEVVCPVCGAAQHEPRLVVTTICRKCGEHLRIEGRKVFASSRRNPVPSAVFPAEIPPVARTASKAEDENAAAPSSPLAKIIAQASSASAPDAPASSAPPEAPAASEEAEQNGTHPSPPKAEPEKRRFFRAPKPERPAEGDPPSGPLPASTLQKMKEQGYYRQQYFKEVECFECHHKFKVGRSAKSTQCAACGVHICLEDFDINTPSTHSILTRGDVLIRKNGNVNASEIKCRDLKVFGMVNGQIECSGDFVLRTAGTIIGEVRCKRFVVEKGSDLRFHNVIHAEDVEVHARVFGNFQCTGRLLIGSHGLIHGDVSACSVSIEPGGQLDGAMNILRATAQKPFSPPSSSAPAQRPTDTVNERKVPVAGS